MNLKRFKIGDVVFVTSDYSMGSMMLSGDIGVIVKDEDTEAPLVETRRGPSHKDNTLTKWFVDEKDLEIYNKKNWCRVFLGFMEMQK